MMWFRLDVNPEPWAVGPVGYSRRGGRMSAYVGRNAQLDAYKQAVAEELNCQLAKHPHAGIFPIEGLVELKFYFWRNRSAYTTPQARTHRKHEADGTNLAKATEDALQGVLLKNDRDVAKCTWEIIEQDHDIDPLILIGIESTVRTSLSELDEGALALLESPQDELPFEDDSMEWKAPRFDAF